MISVALETPLQKEGICIYKTSLLHRPDGYIGFTPSCPPHILHQNCAHVSEPFRREEFAFCPQTAEARKVAGIGFHLPEVYTPRRVGSQILVLRLLACANSKFQRSGEEH